MQRMTGWIVAAAVVLGISAGARGGDGDASWYVVLMQSGKAGWMMERTTVAENGNLISESELMLKIGRGATAVEMSMRSVSEEDRDGRPVRTESVSKQGLSELSRKYDFTKTKVIERVQQGGRLTTNTLDLPEGEWLMPGAAEREAERLHALGLDEYSMRVLDTSMGLQVVELTTTVKGETTVEAFGKMVPAVEHEVVQSVLPGVVTREYVGLDGEMVRTTLALGPGMELTILAADEAMAKSDFEAPELMASTLVKPDKGIKNPRVSTKAKYLLRVPEGKMPELPSDSEQRAEVVNSRQVRVVYEEGAGAGRTKIDRDRYLASSSYADTKDPEIIKLTTKATMGVGDDPRERAEAMRRYVHNHISGKDLSVGFATASEVCRTGEGDCSEHGVLLAAMLRADGIPSRVVSGVMDVARFLGKDGVFGYHMWTQAHLPTGDGDSAWYDYDAMIPGDDRTDATHIALSTSDLSDAGTMNTMVSLANVLGQLEIEVVEVE